MFKKRITSMVNSVKSPLNKVSTFFSSNFIASQVFQKYIEKYPYLEAIMTDSLGKPKFTEVYLQDFYKNLGGLYRFFDKDKKKYKVSQHKMTELLTYLPELKGVKVDQKLEATRLGNYLVNDFELNSSKRGLFVDNLEKFRGKIKLIDPYFEGNDFVLLSFSEFYSFYKFIGELSKLEIPNGLKDKLLKLSFDLNYFIYSLLGVKFTVSAFEIHLERKGSFQEFLNFLPELTEEIEEINNLIDKFVLEKELLYNLSAFGFSLEDIKEANIDFNWVNEKIRAGTITSIWSLEKVKFLSKYESQISKYNIDLASLNESELDKLEVVFKSNLSSEDKQLVIKNKLYLYLNWQEKYLYFESLKKLFGENWDIYFERLNSEQLELLIEYPELKEEIFKADIDELKKKINLQKKVQKEEFLKGILPQNYQNESLENLQKVYDEKFKLLADVLGKNEVKHLFEAFYSKKTKKNGLNPKFIWDILFEIKSLYEKKSFDVKKLIDFVNHKNLLITKEFLNQYSQILSILVKGENLDLAYDLVNKGQFSLVNTITYLSSKKAQEIVASKLDNFFTNLADIKALVSELSFTNKKKLWEIIKYFPDAGKSSEMWFGIIAVLEYSFEKFNNLIKLAKFLKKLDLLDHFEEVFNSIKDYSLIENVLQQYEKYDSLELENSEILSWMIEYFTNPNENVLKLYETLLIESKEDKDFERNKGLDGLGGCSGKEIIRKLEKLGCRVKTIFGRGKIQGKGDHKLVLAPDGVSLAVIPMHNPVKASTLFDILNRLKIKKEDFLNP